MFVLILLLVFSLCYVITPAVIALSWKMGAIDVPMDWRRMHRECVPRNGGIAVFLSFFVGIALLDAWDPFLVSLAFGSGIMLLVGLADDVFGLGPWAKLLFQVAAAFAAVLGSGVTAGAWTVAAVLWVVLLTNAHNFIDGMDGLLCGCSAVEALMLGACFFLTGQGIAGEVALLLMAACLAFRFYNRYPARVFAGDCGSESLGFTFGMLSLLLFDGGMTFGTLTPFFIFAYPLVDLVSSVARRVLHGYSPFRADRAHLHHRIFAAGVSHPECTELLMSVCAASGLLGVLLSTESLWIYACFACVALAWFLTRVRRYILRSGV